MSIDAIFYLDKNLNELSQLMTQIESYALSGDTDFKYILGIYYYLCGDIKNISEIILELKNKLTSFENSKGTSFEDSENLRCIISLLLELRLNIRLKSKEKLIELNDKILNMEIPKKWEGEAHFLLGRSYEILSQHRGAIDHYQRASILFKNQGLSKKNLLCQFNELICKEYSFESIDIKEYYSIITLSIKNRDQRLLGIILNNIAFKLLFVGAYNSSLKILKRSLRFLKNEYFSQNYQLAELNMAHLHYLMGHKSDFVSSSERLIKSSFPEIQNAAKLLIQQYSNSVPNKKLETSDLTEGWRWRLARKLNSLEELSLQEDQLIGLLSIKARTKEELMNSLWGNHLDFETEQIRLKRLISRVRKKRPNLIVSQNGKYALDISNLYLFKTSDRAQEVSSNNQNSNFNNFDNLKGDEKKLIEILKNKGENLKAFDLMQSVYGAKINTEKEYLNHLNRFRQLIFRIRKKFPEYLKFRNGLYYWIQ